MGGEEGRGRVGIGWGEGEMGDRWGGREHGARTVRPSLQIHQN